ncbi:MAG: zinc-ribbon domain-containing protein [Candidatus Ranarchaeia archaeon]|jgi:hypothetical protein
MYCRECGTKNADNAKECLNCSAPLRSVIARRTVTKRPQDECFGPGEEDRMRQSGEQCFALPYSGGIFGAFFGFLIILFGISLIYRVNFWTTILPYVAIIAGSLIILTTLIGLYRYQKKSQ